MGFVNDKILCLRVLQKQSTLRYRFFYCLENWKDRLEDGFRRKYLGSRESSIISPRSSRPARLKCGDASATINTATIKKGTLEKRRPSLVTSPDHTMFCFFFICYLIILIIIFVHPLSFTHIHAPHRCNSSYVFFWSVSFCFLSPYRHLHAGSTTSLPCVDRMLIATNQVKKYKKHFFI